MKEYYRLTKPGIIYGNDLSLVAGFLFASMRGFYFYRFFSVVIGTSLVIAAACVFNNIMDRRIDAQMHRTRHRALVTGAIKPLRALVFGFILGVVGSFILIRGTNSTTVIVGLVGFVDYLLFYGVAKRRSRYGTLVGTIAGSAPIVAGYTAVTGSFSMVSLVLFLIMAAWQMAHFYSIALFRKEDYQRASVPVMPMYKDIKDLRLHIFAYIGIFVLGCIWLDYITSLNWIFLIITVGVSSFWIAQGMFIPTQPAIVWGKQMFKTSLIVLLIFCTMLAAGTYLI